MLTALLEWYIDHGRALPWRTERDPYRVWLREIMLQQTTVAAVIPYFERFLARFPTVDVLAAADEADVLRLWEGLGYYSRARNLHRAAQRIMSDHDGEFPQDVAALQSLPGIGRYTAGAIASFAFEQPAAIVEANTLRLYCRLLGYADDPRSTAGQRALWAFAESLITSPGSPGTINQALMDLGATVCTPTEPSCEQCPVSRWCAAFAAGQQRDIPRPAKRIELTDVIEATVAVRHRGRYLLRRRPHGERWAGLWDFPRYAVTNHEPLSRTLVEQIREQTGIDIALGEQLAEFKHGVTRYRITLRCFHAERQSGRLRSDVELQWASPDEFAALALSMTGRKFARLLA
ncbi:MAG: A/G-specific adenine glycosylase, partial [Planctomycetaceae bacterium]|nr:A/G-specific adenine glycosylase [Planctomycetaceae bacterium]